MIRWAALAVVTPTLVFPFLWAALVLGVLRLGARFERSSFLLRGARRGVVEGAPEGLRIEIRAGKVISVPRSEVLDGWIEPLGGRFALVLRLRGGRRLVVEGDDYAALCRVLAAAGASIEQQVFKVPLGSIAAQHGNGPVFHLLGPFLVGLFSLCGGVSLLAGIRNGYSGAIFEGLFFTLVSLAFGYVLARTMITGEVTVGADGITLKRLFQRRFVPYAEIESAEQEPKGVRVTTRGGEIFLPVGTFVAERHEIGAALAKRIEDGKEASRRSFDGAALGLLDRGGRSVSAWREALAQIAHRGGDYRSSRIESADLAHVIEDASAPPERRIGAALALGSLPDGDALKERVRVAAQASANEPVRIALAKALCGELEDSDLEDEAGLAQAPLPLRARR